MLVGAVLMTLSGAVFATERGGAAGLVLGSVVLGTGHLLSVVGQQAAVANTAGPGRFDSAFGYYTFAASLGQAAGPALITLLGGRGALPDTRPIFLTATALGVVLLVAAPRSCACRAGDRHGGSARRAAAWAPCSALPGLLRALLVSCVVLAAVDITLVYLPALGTDRGLAAGTVGLLLTLRAVASMTSRFFLGRLVGFVGRRRLMIVSVALSAVSMAVVAVPLPLAGAGRAGRPAGPRPRASGSRSPCRGSPRSPPPGQRGRAMSLRLTGNRLGQVLIPSAVGLVAAGVGAAGVLAATAAALAVVGVAARRLAVDGRGDRLSRQRSAAMRSTTASVNSSVEA